MFFPFFSSFFFNIYFFKKYFHFYFVFLLSCVCPILFYYFLNHFYQFVLFPCFILQLAHCVGFVFRLCVFVSLNPNCLISFLTSSICLVDLLLFVLFGCFCFFYMCVFPCFCLLWVIFTYQRSSSVHSSPLHFGVQLFLSFYLTCPSPSPTTTTTHPILFQFPVSGYRCRVLCSDLLPVTCNL